MARTTLRRRAALAGLAAGATLALAPAALATFPGDNGVIAFQRGGDIYTIAQDGSGERQLTSGPADDGHPDWSPDGRQLVFERDGDVYRMSADGTGLAKVLEDGHTPDFSRDGKQVVFSRVVDESGDLPERRLFVANLDGSGAHQIPSGFHVFAPDWSPVDDLIIQHFSSDDGQGALFAQSPGIGTLGWDFPDEPFGELDTRDGSWAPDGRQVAFTIGPGIADICGPAIGAECPPGQPLGVAIMDSDGTDQRVIAPGAPHDPAWSPDGMRIVYTQGVFPDPFTLQIIRPDGTGKRTLTKGSQPDWQQLAPKPPEPKVVHVPGPERVVTVPVEVRVPGPERIVEKVVTRTAQGALVCKVPKAKQRFTLVLRAHKTIRAGMGLKVVVDLGAGKRGKATVAKGQKVGLRAGVR